MLLVVYLALCLLAASYNTKEIVYTMANEDKQNGIMSYSFGKPMAAEEEKAFSWYKDKIGMQQDTPPYRKNPQSLYKPTLDKTKPSKWESLPAIEDIINMFSSKLLDPLGAIPSGQDLLARYAKPTFSSEPLTTSDASPLLSGSGYSPETQRQGDAASSAVADAIIAAPVAAERSGLMARPASDAAPTADTTSAAPEVSTSQAGPWLTGVLDTILVAEGGYQTLPKDKGNYRPDGTLVGTNRGITSQALATYKGVNANTITAEDIKAVTEQDAREIYINNYYLKPKLDMLPDNIRASVFDMNINAGSNSIKILQRLAGLTGEEVDGGMGPNTLKAIEKAAITPDQYADARIKYYKEVVKKDPEKKEFLDGWITRANKYRE